MKVVLAEYAGTCYGVKRALDMALECAGSGSGAYTLGPLIHNPIVVEKLAALGVRKAESLEDVKAGTVIIRSHGVTPDERDKVYALGLPVVDATCPHVLRAQKAAAKLAAQDCHVLVVGEEGHAEVAGLRAYAKREGARVDVVPDASKVPVDLEQPVGIVVQTTQRRANLEAVVSAVRAQGIEPIVKNTICDATMQRQVAAEELAGKVDAMVIVGGRNSSNTTRLAEICAAACERAYHVEGPEEVDDSWFEGCECVGVTAGASTPDDQIERVVSYLEQL